MKKRTVLILRPNQNPVLKTILLELSSLASILDVKMEDVVKYEMHGFHLFLPRYLNGDYCIRHRHFPSPMAVAKEQSSSPYLFDGDEEFGEQSFEFLKYAPKERLWGFCCNEYGNV